MRLTVHQFNISLNLCSNNRVTHATCNGILQIRNYCDLSQIMAANNAFRCNWIQSLGLGRKLWTTCVRYLSGSNLKSHYAEKCLRTWQLFDIKQLCYRRIYCWKWIYLNGFCVIYLVVVYWDWVNVFRATVYNLWNY